MCYKLKSIQSLPSYMYRGRKLPFAIYLM